MVLKFLSEYAPTGITYSRQTRTIIYDKLTGKTTCREEILNVKVALPDIGKIIRDKVNQFSKFLSWVVLGSNEVWANAAMA
jgi:hypothetical protein